MARIIQFLFPIHDTADTQRHSGNNLSLYIHWRRKREGKGGMCPPTFLPGGAMVCLCPPTFYPTFSFFT